MYWTINSRKYPLGVLFLIFIISLLLLPHNNGIASDKITRDHKQNDSEWSIRATVIEACSCPMFCACYLGDVIPDPAGPEHHGHHGKGHGNAGHYCRSNLAFKVGNGFYGDIDLTGIKFWLVSDLGPDFTQGLKWNLLYYNKGTTQTQKDAIWEIINIMQPGKWESFKTAEADINKWEVSNAHAHATIDGGKIAEVKLTALEGNDSELPPVIKNLKWWGVPRNEGFVLMPNEVQAYREGKFAFETSGTNGFVITVEMDSGDTMKTFKKNQHGE